MKNSKLNQGEKDILDSFEQGEWLPVKNQKGEMARHKKYAQNTLRKDRRVNIRMTSKDLEEL
ncbi:hypothetical protein [Pontiella sulfatireligans]|uniref:Uncharacterized protein n=1 Tax=Pontiella sulfatireligans TaxID=2750658 RepID=A0A6C2UMK0_9BACT|nr:hypothetical protein [Pontiella sulfatireligans]VGO20501.1 hypothetical protein SCARR_02564 [Pontiella sulfatireligans]